jgi:hypothetical protein
MSTPYTAGEHEIPGVPEATRQDSWPGCGIDPYRSMQGGGWRGHAIVRGIVDGAPATTG